MASRKKNTLFPKFIATSLDEIPDKNLCWESKEKDIFKVSLKRINSGAMFGRWTEGDHTHFKRWDETKYKEGLKNRKPAPKKEGYYKKSRGRFVANLQRMVRNGDIEIVKKENQFFFYRFCKPDTSWEERSNVREKVTASSENDTPSPDSASYQYHAGEASVCSTDEASYHAETSPIPMDCSDTTAGGYPEGQYTSTITCLQPIGQTEMPGTSGNGTRTAWDQDHVQLLQNDNHSGYDSQLTNGNGKQPSCAQDQIASSNECSLAQKQSELHNDNLSGKDLSTNSLNIWNGNQALLCNERPLPEVQSAFRNDNPSGNEDILTEVLRSLSNADSSNVRLSQQGGPSIGTTDITAFQLVPEWETLSIADLVDTDQIEFYNNYCPVEDMYSLNSSSSTCTGPDLNIEEQFQESDEFTAEFLKNAI